jgi:hypothetical protein
MKMKKTYFFGRKQFMTFLIPSTLYDLSNSSKKVVVSVIATSFDENLFPASYFYMFRNRE